MNKLKQHFLTGLAVILPIILTVFIVQLLLRILTAPFAGIIEMLIKYLDPSLHNPELFTFVSRLLLLFLIVLFTALVGFLGKQFIVNTFLKWGDTIAHNVPLANKIYKSVQDVMKSLIDQERPSFSQVVEVPFPHEGAIALGFITKEQEIHEGEQSASSHVSVFVPGTPNPTMGFILLIPKEKIVLTPLTVEQAIKFIVSCGVIRPAVPGNDALKL